MATKNNYGHAQGAWDGKDPFLRSPVIKSLFDKIAAALPSQEANPMSLSDLQSERYVAGPKEEVSNFIDFSKGMEEGAAAGVELPKFEMPQLPDWQPEGGSDSWAFKAPNPKAEAAYAARMGFSQKPVAGVELAAGVPWQSTVKDNQPGWERGLRTATDPLRAQNIWQIPYRVAEKVNESTGINDAISGFLSSVKPVLKDAANQFTMTVPEYKAQRTKLNQPAPTGKQSLEAMQPLLAAIAPGESGGRWDAQNPGSTAGGKYQILDQAWFGTIAKYGDKMGLPNVQASMYQDKNGKWKFRSAETELLAKQAKMNPVTGELGALYTALTYHKGMTDVLGREPTLQEFKFGWFAGVDAAGKALKSDPNTPASAIFSPDAIKKNPTVFTAGGNTPVRLAISNYDNLGKRARGKGDGAPGVDLSQGIPIANFTTQGPLPLPERQPDKQLDYTALAALLEPLKPKGVDEDLVKKQKRDLWIQGLLSGAQSREGGIPGMLARMAGGGFAGKAQGREYERGMVDKAEAEMQRFQAQKIGLLSQGMQAEVAGQNNVRDVNYANALARVQHENTMRELASTEVSAGGMVKMTTRNPDGSLSTSVYSLAPLFNEIELRQRAAYSGSSGFDAPTEVKKYAESYRYGASLEGPARTAYLYGQLAREIADNPEKMGKILATDEKDFQKKVMQNKLTMTDTNAVSAAIYQEITEMARDNPGAMPGFMKRVKDAGLVGGMLLGGN